MGDYVSNGYVVGVFFEEREPPHFRIAKYRGEPTRFVVEDQDFSVGPVASIEDTVLIERRQGVERLEENIRLCASDVVSEAVALYGTSFDADEMDRRRSVCVNFLLALKHLGQISRRSGYDYGFGDVTFRNNNLSDVFRWCVEFGLLEKSDG